MTSLILNPNLGLDARPNASAREKLHEAAQQFEAIFVRQMLAAARKTSFDEVGVFSGQALQTFRQMQDEHFAEIAAKTGTLGLAAVLEAQMARFLPGEASTGAEAGTQAGDAATASSGKGA